MKHIIETERLILRPWKESDADAIVLGFSDFETAKMLTVPYPYTKEDAVSFILKSKSEDDNNFHFAITLKENGSVIGGTSLCVDRKNNTNRGGIWLNKNYQGLGYGTEAWIARAKFAFFELNLEKLYNGYYYFNQSSPKMQQKIGYKVVGEQERFCPALGQKVREIRTVLSKEDFISKTGIKTEKTVDKC